MLLSALTVLLAVAGGHAEEPGAPVRIGIAVGLSGSYAAFGDQVRTGARQAIDDINKAGGIRGRTLEPVIGDDASDPKQGVSVANKLAAAGVTMVVGSFSSGVSIPASDVYSDAGIIQVSPASTSVKFTERGLWNTFRTCGRDDQQGAVAGAYLAEHFRDSRIAVVHDKSPYGKGLADETRRILGAKGVTPVLFEGINPGEKDYSALVSKLKQNGVDIVYFGGYYTEAGLILRQMRDQGLKAPMMGGDGMVDRELVAIAGPAAEGTLTTVPPDARKNPAAKDAVAAFKAKGIDPEAYTLYAYAAAQIFKQAADAVKSTDGKKVAAYMREGKPFQTVLGPISLDKKGDITKPDYVIYEWKKGKDGQIGYAGNELTQ